MRFFIIFFLTIAIISAYFGYRNTIQEYKTISPLSVASETIHSSNAPSDTPKVLSAFTTATPSPSLPPIFVEPPEEKVNQITLQETVDAALRNTSSTYGVYVKNLKTGEHYAVQEHRIFEPASLYKLWVMGKAYEAIQSGDIRESDILSQTIARLNEIFNIPESAAELTEGSITLSVENALKRMITVSDNYSAMLLSEKLTHSATQRYLVENGLLHSTLGEPPQTTPSEIALFLEQLYLEKLASHQYSEKMLSLLRQQQLNSKIPKYIPEHVSIAHKTGELGYFSHDAGIIYGTRGDYLIVAMSEGTNPEGSSERIAILSKAVFDYFENK